MEAGICWYRWLDGVPLYLEPFNPVLSEPVPRIRGVNGKLDFEAPDEFEGRMMAEFIPQLKAYLSYYRGGIFSSRAYLESHPKTEQYMQMALHRFIGTPFREVADFLAESSSDDPEAFIIRKVNELAKKIGLTLPPWTRK